MDGRILLWRGCTYRRHLIEELEKIQMLLERLGCPFQIIEENCCGYPLFLMGCQGEMKRLAVENAEKLKRFDLIVVPCPACLRAFKEIYEERMGLRLPRVLHLTQFLVEVLRERPIEFREVKMKVMYHDPCELGRRMGIYDEPRALLKLIPGLEIFEQRFTRERSACCGGGGLLTAVAPSIASMAAARKLVEEDRISGELDAIVTACPQCILNMRRGLELWVEDENLRGIKVLDIAQILDMALGG